MERGSLRERSCRLRCSLLLKALAQNWHLYFLSGCVAPDAFRGVGVAVAPGTGVVVAGAAAVGATATLAPGILCDVVDVCSGDDEAALLPLADDSDCCSGSELDGDN